MAMWQVVNCKNGVSSYEVHRAIGVTQKTAWFMDHRIRHALTMGTINKISGQIEADETFIGGKARNMHADKRQRLLRRILASRNSIEESRGILSESYPLIREARER